jgi:hypothetical protein
MRRLEHLGVIVEVLANLFAGKWADDYLAAVAEDELDQGHRPNRLALELLWVLQDQDPGLPANEGLGVSRECNHSAFLRLCMCACLRVCARVRARVCACVRVQMLLLVSR